MGKPVRWPETRRLCIPGATLGLGSNNGRLAHNPGFFGPGEIHLYFLSAAQNAQT